MRLDMSEYMEKHTVSRLIGAPPGYVGYDEGGQLTEAVRRRPYSVVLLRRDREGASRMSSTALLQILDDGRLTDGKGRTVDFKNTVVIMTSNLGSSVIGRSPLGFAAGAGGSEHDDLEKRLLEELRRSFRPEFLNRIDEVIVFDPLTREQLIEVVDLLLTHLRRLVEGQGMSLEVTQEAREFVAEQGYDAEYGARPMKRAIQRLVENPLSSALLRGRFAEGDAIKVGLADGALVFTK